MKTLRVRTNQRCAAVLAAIAGITLGGIVLYGCGPAKQAAQQGMKTVTTVPVARSSIIISLAYSARIRPVQEIVVSPKIAGRVATVDADVSQRVRKGDVLFTLESEDYETQARQAQAALESAKGNLTRTSDSSLSSQVLQAQAAVKQAQVQRDDAKDLYDRTQKLFDAGTASQQQLDGAKARFDSAGIALDTAQQNLALIQDKGGPQSTGVASSQVDQAQATADLAESQLSNAIITSPLTGVVASRNVDPGELVSSAVPAFVVIDVSAVNAEASVEESQIEKIHVGEVVAVGIDAAVNAKLTGMVQTISPSVDLRTQGYTVKIHIDNPGDIIRPGMLARVSFPVEKRENVLVVPNTAVVTETGVDYVYTVAQGTVKKIAVETGISDDAVTEIISGLAEGVPVITEGQSFLNDGQKVTPAG
ncbi:MAG: efflux RND transporter periplasmic adaptor subunit [Spirochaetia bacterium]|jgi:multidrug efflux pump subunit AcrA (membrane-fusion protein)